MMAPVLMSRFLSLDPPQKREIKVVNKNKRKENSAKSSTATRAADIRSRMLMVRLIFKDYS